MPSSAAELWDVLVAEAGSYSQPLRKAFLRAIAKSRTRTNFTALTNALLAGNPTAIVELLLGPIPTEHQPYLWHELMAALEHAVVKATGYFSGQLMIDHSPALRVVFGVQNPRALAALRTSQLNLIREIDTKTREGIRSYVLESLQAGRNPRSIVQQLAGTVQPDGTRKGGIIGLTERQARAVSNYRKHLESLSPESLARALRDKRYDKTVARAIRDDTPLNASYVTKLVQRYESNYLAYRAETIARTESLKALQLGQRLAWDEAIVGGAIDPTRLTKRWVTARDERVRPTHQDMEGVVVEYDEDFDPEDTGPIWAPPVAPNCRCIAWIRPSVEQVVE